MIVYFNAQSFIKRECEYSGRHLRVPMYEDSHGAVRTYTHLIRLMTYIALVYMCLMRYVSSKLPDESIK